MILIITGPSGSGKTTLANLFLDDEYKNFSYLKSVTTRDKREESDDKYYDFVSVEEFKKLAIRKKFIEWEEIYPNKFYGTPFVPLSDFNNIDVHVMVKDVQGAKKLKKIYGAGCYVVMLKAEDENVIIERLEERDGELLDKERVKKTSFENNFDENFADIVIKVDDISPKIVSEIVMENLKEYA